MDQWGACKVCGGELPHGHMDNCDILEMECELRGYRECEKLGAPLSCPLHGLVPNLASFDNKCPTCEVERLTLERDEWARKWHRIRGELAEIKWPGMKGVIRPKRAYYETHDPPHCPTCECGR